jgi:hypothetical protein
VKEGTRPSWIPVKPVEFHELPNDIKYPLARKYQDHDGSLSGKNELTKEDIPYLEGLGDGGNPEIGKGSSILIEAIKKYETILFIIE